MLFWIKLNSVTVSVTVEIIYGEKDLEHIANKKRIPGMNKQKDLDCKKIGIEFKAYNFTDNEISLLYNLVNKIP